VKFAEGSGLAVLVGNSSAVAVGQGREATAAHRGKEARPRTVPGRANSRAP
jgi:hypothetical protein